MRYEAPAKQANAFSPLKTKQARDNYKYVSTPKSSVFRGSANVEKNRLASAINRKNELTATMKEIASRWDV